MFFSRSKSRITLAVLLLVPVFSYWIINTDSRVNNTPKAVIINGVDYFMKEVSSKEFNAQGELLRTLSADTLQHFPQDKLAKLEQPRINLFSKNTLTLTAQSQSGTSFDDTDQLDLVEQVIVTHNPLSVAASVLKTSTLSLHQAQGIAKTSAPVVITKQAHITTATGMIINYKTNTSELLSDVKGTFYAK